MKRHTKDSLHSINNARVAGSAGDPGPSNISDNGMASSVTRHAQNPPCTNFQFMLCGIDSLDLGLFVRWNDNWKHTREQFEAAKSQAQESKSVIGKTDLDREFIYLPSGKPPNYRYGIRFKEYLIYIAKSDSYRDSPNVYVSLSSALLWHESFSTIIDLLALDIEYFGGTIENIQPSRCDLAVDFRLTPPPNYQFLEQTRISRSRMINSYVNSGVLETYYCGSPTAPAKLRIYDKGKEILKSSKLWFKELWHTDDPENIWRVEFQLRRTFLHQYRIFSLNELWDTIGDIWTYLTEEWFSLRLPDNDKAERRTILPWWAAVQACGELLGVNNGERRRFDSDNPQLIENILPQVYSRMITIAALSGINDRIESIKALAKLLEKNSSNATFQGKLREKLMKLGYRGQLGGADDDLPF